MKTLIVFTFFIPFFCFGQKNCDSVVIEKIINNELKIADKWFDRPYVLSNSSVPYDPNKYIYKTDSIYVNYACTNELYWNQYNLRSEFCSIESDSTTNMEYSLFISSPLFNADLTKCRFVVNTHFSEWGGQVRYCFYERRGKEWKFVRSTLISVS